MIKAVIFNIDGTIFTEKGRFAAWKKAGFKVQSVNVPYIWYKTLGMSEEDTKNMFCQIYGFRTYNKFIKLAEKYYDRKPKLAPSIPYLLDEFKNNGVKLAAISSLSYTEALDKLNAFNLTKYFDTIITADDSPLSRPNPEPYSMIPMKLHIKLKHTAVMEGSENGCISAIRAGYKQIFFLTDTVRLERALPFVSEFARNENHSQFKEVKDTHE